MKKQNFVKGTMILVVGGLITRALGTIYRIFLSRMIGPEAIGLYQMSFPTLIMMITIVTAGLPIAVSKLVAEAEAEKDLAKVKKVLHIALSLVILISLIVSFLFYLLIPLISKYFLTDERVYYTLIIIIPIIPIISISSVLRGYFQGKQNMIPSAMSTIIETIFRMIFGMIFSLIGLEKGVEYASAGAMIGMVIGEMAGFLTLLIQYQFHKNENRPVQKQKLRPLLNQNENIYHKINRIALPVTTSQVIGSLAYFIEPSIVSHSLAIAGISTAMATALYGQLAGMALLVLFFPTVITYSLSLSLIPAISEAAARKEMSLVYKRLHQALNIAYMIGLPASVVMFIMADPLANLLFATPQVGHLMKIMAPFAIFLYIQRPLAATLQGLDQAKESMKNSIIGAIAKTIAIFVLASNPRFGIDGVAMAINLGMMLVTVLHFRCIVHLIGYTIKLKPILTIGLSSLAMGYISYLVLSYAKFPFPLGIRMILSLVLSLIAYLYLLLLFKVIKKQDIARIPWIGPGIARILP
ncbi:stage V sporulation protein B [Tepidibacillus sp. HK-1]|uniref:stage V sporulation protein B n=1 Tax=Tepidibacillus sp. HK-1 TaxID=1883407 RepID=UPI0008537653|nr:stage V sporulation protein B [Tepidibacillus sp. HK-1]GBF10046.1 stage V sporulation protein B [Tepidibacillus sp. HK-1]